MAAARHFFYLSVEIASGRQVVPQWDTKLFADKRI
jgi:hypothetical protein